jgi:hypothetical protein
MAESPKEPEQSQHVETKPVVITIPPASLGAKGN